MLRLSFIDLSVSPRSEEELLRLAERARLLGYAALGVDHQLYQRLREGPAALRLRAYPRITVEASGKDDLFRALSRAPSDVIVAADVRGLEAYRYAARSKRVDIIRLDPRTGLFPDRSTLNLFRVKGGGAIEISLRPLLEGEWGLKELRDVLQRALRRGLRVVLVSDAARAEDLWHPLHVIGLVRSLGLPSELALMGLASAPGFIISRRGLSPP
ncbi:MAG: RNase P subunit p30 family protein [Acidilobus sp.]